MAIGDRRRPRLIQEVFDERRTNTRKFSKEMRLSYSTVYETIQGKRNNRKVLKKLLEIGVAPEHLDLPDDMLSEGRGI